MALISLSAKISGIVHCELSYIIPFEYEFNYMEISHYSLRINLMKANILQIAYMLQKRDLISGISTKGFIPNKMISYTEAEYMMYHKSWVWHVL